MIVNSINNLCLLIAKDDLTVFKTFFKLLYVRWLQFTEAFFKSIAEGEELVQDVFIKWWTNHKTLPAIKNLNYYLLVAVKHNTFNSLEKNKRNANISIDEAKIDFVELCMNPTELLIATKTISKIQKPIDTLSALQLSYNFKYKFDENNNLITVHTK